MFVVIEGLDGSGGNTQTKHLKEFLSKNNKKCEIIRYPDYDGPIGKLILDFLNKKFDIDAYTQFALYAADMIKDREKLKQLIDDNTIVVADRYITSTLAYQSLNGFSFEKGLKFIELFELPKPDIIIFLDISSQTSISRKFKENGKHDRHEGTEKLLNKVRENYHNLIEKKILTKEWFLVDGEKSIDEVAKEIQKIVLKKL